MKVQAKLSSAENVLPWRTRQREEANGQIVHDSIHKRPGWTESFLFAVGGITVGFGSIAIGGPWKNKPTIFEFYLLPPYRIQAFEIFEVFLAASGAAHFEVQTSDTLLTVMLHTYAQKIVSEKIVFHDKLITCLPPHGGKLRRVTTEKEIKLHQESQQGGGEWLLEVEGVMAAKGGILFHYNRPYGDIYMEVADAFRKRGLGSYLVQELKSECYKIGAIPCARCNPDNVASRRTLQRAGFVPYAHILKGSIRS